MYMSVEKFDKEIKRLKNKGYTPITFNDIENSDVINKPVIVTFDDGYEDNNINAYPILKKYGVKATIFLCANFIGKNNYLSIDQINDMKDIVDFQSHTINHKNLAEIDEKSMEYEIGESKRALEELLGKKIDVIAYPYGSYSKRTIDITKKYYKYGVTFTIGEFYFGVSDNYEIRRYHNFYSINTSQ